MSLCDTLPFNTELKPATQYYIEDILILRMKLLRAKIHMLLPAHAPRLH